MPPWENLTQPNQGNVRNWLDNLYAKFQPLEQARWNESNVDTLFYAGSQEFVNKHFGFNQGNSFGQRFNFNIVQQPINMVGGFQRQHRKSINYIPTEGADPHTTDQYTRIIDHVANVEGINEQFSKACELAAISGMVLLQPYLDYTGDDPAQGSLKLKIWEYNSFLADPYFRDPSGADANFFWCQEYISKREADARFPDRTEIIAPMEGTPQRLGRFYFLPENYNMNRNDLMVVSYIYYKWKDKKKRLYSQQRNQFFDFGGGDTQLEEILYNIPDLQVVEVESPVWKLATILNDQLMFQGNDPLDPYGSQCPLIPVFWNYDPHINQWGERVRSLVRPMRSAQWLFSRRVLLNHDISESSINTGYKRKVGAVANEDNLKKTGQGWDILINEGYEMQDVEKIIPNAVPPSDMALADQLMSLIYATSGVNVENWSAQDDKQVSGLTVLLKQGANLMVLQKYFDQWDFALKLLGGKLLSIILNNWNAAKVGLLLGEDPSPHFYSRIFAKYQVVVAEGLNTATQKNQEFMQWMDLNASLGGIIPPSEIAKRAVIQGKDELVQILAQQEQQQAAQAELAQNVASVLEEAKVKELYSKAVSNIATARERHGRAQSDLGLYEERLAEVTKNHALATKAKAEALAKIVEVTSKYGEMEAHLKMNDLKSLEGDNQNEEDIAKRDAQKESMANDFVAQMLASMSQSGGQQAD